MTDAWHMLRWATGQDALRPFQTEVLDAVECIKCYLGATKVRV